jgi:ABC-type transporter Mla subunit MlaD
MKAVEAAVSNRGTRGMWLIVLEALVALALLVFAVWWTMFSGRRRGERSRDDDPR